MVRSVTEVAVGEELPPATLHVDRARLVAYAGASGDRNPIHWDERFATSVGLPDVIAHGMWTMGAAVQVVADWVGDPGRVVEYGTRFTRPIPVPYDGGADVDVSAAVTSVDEQSRRAVVTLTVAVDGSKVLGKTDVTVQLD